MKILEVLDTFYPNVDGPINCIVNLAKILKEKGLAEVEILVPDNPKHRVEIDGLKIHRTPSIPGGEGYRGGIPWINSKTRKIIKNGNYDIIHVNSPFAVGKYAIKWANILNIPSVFTIHTKYKEDFERLFRTKFMQRMLLNYIMKAINNADYVTAVSNGASDVVKSYGYKGDKVYVIRNGTDMIPSEVSKELVENIKQEYGLYGQFVFLTVGRIVSVKNIQFSLLALKGLKESGVKNFKFLIVGSGEYVKTLQQLTKEYNIEDNVIFTGKILDREKLAAIYSVSDLFLFPSTFDTCGLVVMEAAANNVPSIVVENSCPAEMINNNVSGFILPLQADVWAQKLKDLMENKDSLSKIKENARKYVYVNWDTVALEYYDFFQKILNQELTK